MKKMLKFTLKKEKKKKTIPPHKQSPIKEQKCNCQKQTANF